MLRLGDVAHGKDNHFNLIRMVAASSVLVAHSYPIAGQAAVQPLVADGFTIGTLAVIIFFGVSGFFITSSFARNGNAFDFIVHRVLRLMPAFMLSTIAGALLLGPLVSTLAPSEYFSSWQPYRHIAINLSFRHPIWDLPGVFSGNPMRNVLNGSIWTLRYEVMCYVAALAVGMFAARFGQRAQATVLAALSLAYIGFRIRWNVAMPDHDSWLILVPGFFMGSVLYTCRQRVPLSVWIVLALVAATMLSRGTAVYIDALIATLTYGALYLGYRLPRPILGYNKVGDYSYGMYIYAFPIQQTVMYLRPSSSAIELLAISFPITLALAIASWHALEKPALALKRSLRWERVQSLLLYPRAGRRSAI